LASLDWFLQGGFSSDPLNNPHRVDATALSKTVTLQSLTKAFQVSEENPLVGAEGRCNLLIRLGSVLESHPTFFRGPSSSTCSSSPPRPGNLLDFLLEHPSTIHPTPSTHIVQIDCLWSVIMDGISGVWPPTRVRLFHFNSQRMSSTQLLKCLLMLNPDYSGRRVSRRRVALRSPKKPCKQQLKHE
jgi:hypothetical protein